MQMKLHKEGYPVILLVFFLLLAVFLALNLVFPVQTIFHYLIYLAGIIFYYFVLRFFRNPERKLEPDPFLVFSGADGKIVVIEDVVEKEYFQDKRKQVSVFMSPTDIHVNWYPVGGEIKYFRHIMGDYIIASLPKSSDRNERTSIVIETSEKQEVMFRQIAGTVARRIVCYAKEGKIARQGDELGIIKFGSRFDLFLPLDAEILVRPGQKVIGCTTPIARLIRKGNS